MTMGFVARLSNLVRGLLARWIGHREHRNPEAVYEAAIQQRLDQYTKLRGAAAGVLYMRSKLARELERQSAELTRLRRQLDVAVERGDDAAALVLIGRRNGVAADVERLTGDLGELEREAETAKRNLVAFQDEIVRLRDEKVRMVARLANARARLRLQETLSGLSPEADIRALDEVRDHVNRLVAETTLSRDVADAGLAERLDRIRTAEADAGARTELEELKRSRAGKLVPMVMPQAAARG
jgi:phage shock protein A